MTILDAVRPVRPNSIATGIKHYADGIRLLMRKELRLYVLVPVAVNIVIFIILTGFLIHYFSTGMDFLLNWVPGFLHFLAWIIWLIAGGLLLFCYGYIFNAITNIVASPFYGFLAQKTEELITGEKVPEEPLAQMIPRVIGREMQKLWYFITRGVLVFIILLILGGMLVTSPAVPVIAALWGAWCMAIQYADYACDNNQMPFQSMRAKLNANKYSSIGFGGSVMLASMIPIINIFAMPAAVTGGAVFWVKELK